MGWVYINGEFYPEEEAKISVFDHGFFYGDGVFEGIRAYNGRIFRFDEHIDRLYDSAKAILLEIPMTKDEMKKAIIECLRRNGLRDAYIRPIVTRGVGDLGLDPRKCKKPTVIIITREWGKMYGDLYERGLHAVSVGVRRISPAALVVNVKSLNYLNNILGKIEANVKGADEAIFLDDNGYICEGSGDNIFVVKKGKIYTPPALLSLRGITREVVFELCERLGYDLKEQNISLFDLYTADEVFVTGTAAEIAPVTKIDGRVIGNGKVGAITKRLMEEFEKLTQEEGTPIYED
jgi:branched-chain amino acid aminotransferase